MNFTDYMATSLCTVIKEYCYCLTVWHTQKSPSYTQTDIEQGIIESSDVSAGISSGSEYVSLADDPIESWFMAAPSRRAQIIASRPGGVLLRLNQV